MVNASLLTMRRPLTPLQYQRLPELHRAKNRYYDLRPLEARQSPASGGYGTNPVRSVFRLRPRGGATVTDEPVSSGQGFRFARL